MFPGQTAEGRPRILTVKHDEQSEGPDMSKKNKEERRKEYIRIGALVIAGIMVITVVIAGIMSTIN